MTISVVTKEKISDDNPFASLVNAEVTKTNPFYDIARSIEQEIEDNTEQNLNEVVEEVETGEPLSDVIMGVRAFLDGQTLGLSSEVTSNVSSLALKMFWPDLFKDKSTSELRSEIINELENEEIQWAAENPKTALGLNVTGGILSPANYLGISVIQKAKQARDIKKATDVATGVQTSLRGVAGAAPAIGATQQAATGTLKTAQLYSGMSPAMFNVLSRTPTPLIAAGVGSVEGAIAGYGFAGQDEKEKGAAVGAALGAGFPIVLKGAGLASDAVSKSRLAQPLGKGKDFISIMFTESAAGGFYRTIVSKPFFSQGLVEQQARQTSGKVLMAVGNAKERLQNSVQRSSVSLEATKRNINKNADKELQKLIQKKEDTLAKLKNEANEDHSALIEDAAKELEDLKLIFTKTKADIEHAVLRNIDAETNEAAAAFTSFSRIEAMPSTATKAQKEAVQSMSPQETVSFLDEVWKTRGFSSAKNKKFIVKPANILATVDNILEKDSRAYLALKQSASPTLVQDIIKRTLEREVKDGKISGDSLVNLRSEVGIILNGLTENKALVRESVDNIQNYLDDLILKQLTPKQKISFNQDKFKYATKNVLEGATFKATGRKGAVEGSYTAEDWISSSKQNKYFSTRGTAPLQSVASQVSANNVARDKMLKEQASKQLAETVKTNLKDASLVNRELTKQKALVSKVRIDEEKKARDLYRSSKKTTEDKAVLDSRLAEARNKHQQNISVLKQQIDSASEQIKFLKENSGKTNISFFEQSYSAGLIGSLLTKTAFGLKTQALGNVLSLGFAGEGAQRAIAGQTRAQEAIRGSVQQALKTKEALTSVGLDVSTAGTIAAGQEAQDSSLLISPQAKVAILKGGNSRMKAVYLNLKNKGQLERLKVQDRDLYEKLKKAAGE